MGNNNHSGSGYGRGVLLRLLPRLSAKPNNRYCLLRAKWHHHPQGVYKGNDKERREERVMDWGGVIGEDINLSLFYLTIQ